MKEQFYDSAGTCLRNYLSAQPPPKDVGAQDVDEFLGYDFIKIKGHRGDSLDLS